MRNTLITLACSLALVMNATRASALAIWDGGHGDPGHWGCVNPDASASALSEAANLDSLMIAIPGFVDDDIRPFEVGRGLEFVFLPKLPNGRALSESSRRLLADIDGDGYVLARYHLTATIWIVKAIWVSTESTNGPAAAAPHGPAAAAPHGPAAAATPVPDGGATLGLLGLAILGLGLLRRRMS